MNAVAVMAKASDQGKAQLDAANAERLRGVLLAYLARRAGDRTLAEDLTQEAMVHIIKGLPEFRGNADLRTWARRVALNVWHDHLRRRSANPTERAGSGDQFSVGALLDSIGPRSPALAPDDAYDQRVTHDCLIAAARRLPLAEREIILLHDFGVIALERAAATLGCSVGAAKVRLHRARRHLAELCRAECRSETGAAEAILCTPRTTPVPPPAEMARPPRRKRRN